MKKDESFFHWGTYVPIVPKQAFFVMKLSFFLLLAGCLQVSAKGYSQLNKVTVHVEQVSLMKLLKIVEKKANCRFVYNDDAISPYGKVSVQVTEAPVEDLLKQALANTDLHFRLLKSDLFVIAPNDLNIADISVNGKVTDKNGVPLVGVSVRVDKTQKGTITNANGEFTLEVPGTGNLVFTYMGYLEQLVPINSNTSINIILQEDPKGLNEVVVVGYGTQKKVSLTGSVATISGKDMRQMPTANLSNSLVGRAPGIIAVQRSGEPGNDQSNISIRGKSTFGDNSMLVIVDGIPRAYEQLNPGDIETVTVLKDASAAAIYGARAANGVLLVTTKRGSKGVPTISYNGFAGFQQPTRYPKLLNSTEYMQMYNDGLRSNGQQPLYSEADIATVRDNPDPLRNLANTDWWKETNAKSAMQTQHDLSVSGGGEKARYFVSLGFLDQDGLFKSSNFKRYNFRSNLDANIGRRLNVSVDLAGRFENRQAPGVATNSIFNSILRAKPMDPAFYPNGLPGGSTGGVNATLDALSSGYRNEQWNIFQSNLSLKYDVPGISGLTIKGVAAFDKSYRFTKNFLTPYDYYKYNATSKDYDKITQSGSISLKQEDEQRLGITTQAIVNYVQTFGLHNVDATFVWENYKYNSDVFSAYREQYTSALLDQLFAGSQNGLNNDGTASIDGRSGVAGRINYGWMHKYLLTATFRYDGSINFPKNKRWGFFPGISAGWVVSEENFFKDHIRAMEYLKLKASYGQLGNDRVGMFQYMPSYYLGNGKNDNGQDITSTYIIDGKAVSGIFTTGYPNANITWETATTNDFGVEASLWNRALTIDAGYFYKRTKNILLPRKDAVPGTFGEKLPDQNIGIVDNRGFELELGHESKIGQVNFNAKGTFTAVRSKIIYMDEAANILPALRKTGRPFDQYTGLKAIGIFQSQDEISKSPVQQFGQVKPGDIKYADIDGNGKVDDNDRVAIGKSQIPELIYGLNLGFSWKGFDGSMLWQGAANFNTYLSPELSVPFFNGANSPKSLLDYWTPENTNAKYPRPVPGGNANNRKVSSFWLRDASYIKLKNIVLGYSLPDGLLKRARLQQIRVYVAAANLLTISRLKDIDPEIPSDIRGYYPQQRSVNFGINLTL